MGDGGLGRGVWDGLVCGGMRGWDGMGLVCVVTGVGMCVVEGLGAVCYCGSVRYR